MVEYIQPKHCFRFNPLSIPRGPSPNLKFSGIAISFYYIGVGDSILKYSIRKIVEKDRQFSTSFQRKLRLMDPETLVWYVTHFQNHIQSLDDSCVTQPSQHAIFISLTVILSPKPPDSYPLPPLLLHSTAEVILTSGFID